MNDRTLSLRCERLAELTDADLAEVAGGDISLQTCITEKLEDLFETMQATRCFCP